MTFARRVARLTSHQAVLDDVEKQGNPHAIAAHHIELTARVETFLIGAPRASKLYNDCVRMRVLGTYYALELTSRITFKRKLTFVIGDATHWFLQNRPDIFGDRRVGWWRCSACNRILYFGKPPKKRCHVCNARTEAIVYQEHAMNLLKPYRVSGHPDLFLEKADRFRVVEIKTLNGPQFDKLVAPEIEHEWQVQTYTWDCPKDKKLPVSIDPALGYVLYVSKMEHADQLPMKMFPVRRDPNVIQRIEAKLATYEQGLVDFPNNVPDLHDECARKQWRCYRAKACPAFKPCMELAA